MDADPNKRTTVKEICEIIRTWYNPINGSLEVIIRNEFEEMDKIEFDPSTITATVHPNAVYTSRLLKFTNLPQPINSNKVTIIGNNSGNYQLLNNLLLFKI